MEPRLELNGSISLSFPYEAKMSERHFGWFLNFLAGRFFLGYFQNPFPLGTSFSPVILLASDRPRLRQELISLGAIRLSAFILATGNYRTSFLFGGRIGLVGLDVKAS